MKFAIVLVLVAVTACYAVDDAPYEGNGQPGCKSQEELDIGVFRNPWDPTAYWKCVQLNEAGELERCADGTAFLASAKECVLWSDWQWVQPSPPLSVPGDEPEEVTTAASAE